MLYYAFCIIGSIMCWNCFTIENYMWNLSFLCFKFYGLHHMEYNKGMMIEELPDWQKRFVIEYKELLTKTIKLGNMLDNWDSLNFTPKCSRSLLSAQYNTMKAYLSILEERAVIEGVDLRIIYKVE